MILTYLHPMTGTYPRIGLQGRGIQEEGDQLGLGIGLTAESGNPTACNSSTHRSFWVVLASLFVNMFSEWLAMYHNGYQADLLLATDKGTNFPCEDLPFSSLATVNDSEFIKNRIHYGSPNNSKQNGKFIIWRPEKSFITESTRPTRGTTSPKQSQRRGFSQAA
jgi:hypothetical protein